MLLTMDRSKQLNKVQRRHCYLLLLLALLSLNIFCLPSVSAYLANGDYLPNSHYGKIFPQICVIPEILKTKDIALNGITGKFDSENSQLNLTGSDKLGKIWKLKLLVNAAGGSIWRSDLDNNGQPDLIVLLGVGGCGLAPTSRLVLLMFDENHTPRPYVITGYFIAKKNGIEDLRSIPGHKNAVLIEQVLANATKADKNYWRTTAWTAENQNWTEVSELSQATLPAYIFYTHRPNHRVAKPVPAPKVYGAKDVAIQSAQNKNALCDSESFAVESVIRTDQSEGAAALPSPMKVDPEDIDASHRIGHIPGYTGCHGYMTLLQRAVIKKWNPPQGTESLIVILVFKVHKDGSITDLKITRSAGREDVDNAAIEAVQKAVLYPLPIGTADPVEIQFTFDKKLLTYKWLHNQ